MFFVLFCVCGEVNNSSMDSGEQLFDVVSCVTKSELRLTQKEPPPKRGG